MDESEAWENYWRNHGGCVPNSIGVNHALRHCWRDFASQLPLRARVLDLGSGAGAVLDNLCRERRDLELVGIDCVNSLPRNTSSVLTGIHMEELPFPDSYFDAVCSQFGIEYSDLPRTVREVARTAKNGARFRFVVHDASGPIVKQGRSRRRALVWASEESCYFPLAERLAESKFTAPLPIPATLKHAVDTARKAFPREPVASEVMLALLRIVHEAETASRAETIKRLRWLFAQIQSERTTLDALLRSAKDDNGIAELAASIASKNAALEKPKKIVDPASHLSIAWLLGGRFGSGE